MEIRGECRDRADARPALDDRRPALMGGMSDGRYAAHAGNNDSLHRTSSRFRLSHLLLLHEQPVHHVDDVADAIEAVDGFVVRNADLKPIFNLEDDLYRIQ